MKRLVIYALIILSPILIILPLMAIDIRTGGRLSGQKNNVSYRWIDREVHEFYRDLDPAIVDMWKLADHSKELDDQAAVAGIHKMRETLQNAIMKSEMREANRPVVWQAQWMRDRKLRSL